MKWLTFLLICLPIILCVKVGGATGTHLPTGLIDISTKELGQVLINHQTWLKARGQNIDLIDLRANLSKVYIGDYDLSVAQNGSVINLANAILIGTYFDNTNLHSAELSGADLTKADLGSTNLRKASLRNAVLKDASLVLADFSKASLDYADLSGVYAFGTNFTEANMDSVNFTGANLLDADFTGVGLFKATLTNALFEPKVLPSTESLSTASGLSEMYYQFSPQGFVTLRNEFNKAGFRKQEREVTYALNHTRTAELIKSKSLTDKIEGWGSRIFFEWTTEWGMSPSRALYLIFLFNIIFTIIYYIKIYAYPNGTSKPNTLAALYAIRTPISKPKAGIWRIWEKERVCKVKGSSQPEEVTEKSWKAVVYALQFSILSTFHFGWRDLNVGNWISRMQPREYSMRATGWVRTVSGIQSLISVYLLAISVLSYFGRPFD